MLPISSAEGRPKCQEVRALAVDAEVERLILEALTPDRIALAVAALGEIEEETRTMERQWTLKRERARYDAERARRQYDAVEPENRLVARSLERVWEERLRRVDQIEQEYNAWRREQAVAISESDRQEILALGEDLPRLWDATTTTISGPQADRSTGRSKRSRWIRSVGVATSGSGLSGRLVRQASIGCSGLCRATRSTPIRTVCASASSSSMASKRWMARSPTSLTRKRFRTAHGPPFSGGMVHQLRKRWQIATVKINGKAANPPRWPDGTYSVQGAAAAIGITPQIIFDWLRRGWLTGKQLAKGMPWQIRLTPEQAIELRAKVRRTNRSKREAS